MSIDLDSTEGRKQYLSDKLDDLLDGINESYGTVLMEELLNRMELTIRDFNDEMKTLCDQLIKKQEERQHLLEMIKSREGFSSQTESEQVSPPGGNPPSKDLEEDLPIWEKKLAKLEKK